MDENKIERLIAKYDCSRFFEINYDEWSAITQSFKTDYIIKILRKAGKEFTDREQAIKTQLELLDRYNDAYSAIVFENNVPYEWNANADIRLMIRAGEFIDTMDDAVPVLDDDKTPDYDALQVILTGYKDLCEKMAFVAKDMVMKMERDADYVKQIEKMNKYYQDKLDEKDGIITDLQSKIDVLGGYAAANGSVVGNHDDLNAFIAKLIEQADKERARDRREFFYLYLTSVFRSVKHKLPKGTMDALEILKVDKSAPVVTTVVQAQNYYGAGSVHDDKSKHLGGIKPNDNHELPF